MKHSSQRVSKIALEVCKKANTNNISYGDLDTLHEIFILAGLEVSVPHPLNRHQAVLNALDRESKYPNAIFDKKYFRAYRGLGRMFTLKEIINEG